MPEIPIVRRSHACELPLVAALLLAVLGAACASADAGPGEPVTSPDGAAAVDPSRFPAGPSEIDVTPVAGSPPAPPLERCTTYEAAGAAAVCPDFNPGGLGVLSFSSDGKSLATAGPGWVDLWDVTASGLVAAGRLTPTGPAAGPGQLRGAFSPDGKLIATLAASSGTVRLHGFPELDLRHEFPGLKPVAGGGAGVGFSADGTRVIASDGQAVRVWRTDGASEGGHSLPEARPRAFVISPRQPTAKGSRTPSGWVAFDDPLLDELVLLNLDTGFRQVHRFGRTILSLALSGDGSEISVGLIGKRTGQHVVGGEIARLAIGSADEPLVPIGGHAVAGREALDLARAASHDLLVGIFGSSAGTGLPGEGDGFIQMFSQQAPRTRAGGRLPGPGAAVAIAPDASVVAYRLIGDCAHVTVCQVER